MVEKKAKSLELPHRTFGTYTKLLVLSSAFYLAVVAIQYWRYNNEYSTSEPLHDTYYINVHVDIVSILPIPIVAGFLYALLRLWDRLKYGTWQTRLSVKIPQ